MRWAVVCPHQTRDLLFWEPIYGSFLEVPHDALDVGIIMLLLLSRLLEVRHLTVIPNLLLIPREAAHRFRDDGARLFRNILAH